MNRNGFLQFHSKIYEFNIEANSSVIMGLKYSFSLGVQKYGTLYHATHPVEVAEYCGFRSSTIIKSGQQNENIPLNCY